VARPGGSVLLVNRRYGDTITVVHAPVTQDPYTGNDTRDWDNATRTTVAADVQPASEQELNDRRQVTVTRWAVECSPVDTGGNALTVEAADRVEWHGAPRATDGSSEPLDIDGEVGVFMRHSVPHHLEFTLKRFSE
jgi:hypothetical protein